MKGVWTVSIIVYLIIATVFILNNQFSQEAFAIPNALPSDLSSNDHVTVLMQVTLAQV